MRITLRRIYLPDATLGVLDCDGLRLWTLEDVPGAGTNHCVPEGVYSLEPHHGPKYQDTWALVGPGVSHTPKPGNRSAILIHSGNTVADSTGCILVGREAALWPVSVFHSRVAMQALRDLLGVGSAGHELAIQRG